MVDDGGWVMDDVLWMMGSGRQMMDEQRWIVTDG